MKAEVWVAVVGALTAAATASQLPTASYGVPEISSEYSAESPDVKYDFDWSVKNDYSGNSFTHQETRDDDHTRGSYSVQLPDGRLQTVTYYVDGDSGYVAEVKYEGEAQYPDPKSQKSYTPPRPSYATPRSSYASPRSSYATPEAEESQEVTVYASPPPRKPPAKRISSPSKKKPPSSPSKPKTTTTYRFPRPKSPTPRPKTTTPRPTYHLPRPKFPPPKSKTTTPSPSYRFPRPKSPPPRPKTTTPRPTYLLPRTTPSPYQVFPPTRSYFEPVGEESQELAVYALPRPQEESGEQEESYEEEEESGEADEEEEDYHNHNHNPYNPPIPRYFLGLEDRSYEVPVYTPRLVFPSSEIERLSKRRSYPSRSPIYLQRSPVYPVPSQVSREAYVPPVYIPVHLRQ